MRLLLLNAIFVASIGCSAASTGIPGAVSAEGQVLLDGSPVEKANVLFAPIVEGGRSARGVTDAQGRFSMGVVEIGDGVLPGEYHVAVLKADVVEPKESPAEFMKRTGRYPEAEMIYHVPERYAKARDSGLKAVIAENGTYDLKFELTSN